KCFLQRVLRRDLDAVKLEPQRPRGGLHFFQFELGLWILRIEHHRHRRYLGDDFFEQFESFPLKSGATILNPVAFPPGRARLSTRPAATGSPMIAITIGIVPVALLSAFAAAVPPVRRTSTLRPTRSAARSESPSPLSCPHFHS